MFRLHYPGMGHTWGVEVLFDLDLHKKVRAYCIKEQIGFIQSDSLALGDTESQESYLFVEFIDRSEEDAIPTALEMADHFKVPLIQK